MGRVGKYLMHDAHCHLDLYPDPYIVATMTDKAGIRTIAVTNLPSAFFKAKPHMRPFRYLYLAVGLHPLLAESYTSREKKVFQEAIATTDFVGEVGLDFSRYGAKTKDAQTTSFRFVLEQLQSRKRFVTLHSRGAEAKVLELLTEYAVSPVVFHWYSGPLKTLENILVAGHYFSVNTSMIKTPKGARTIKRIPRDRLLTETDGPFIKHGNALVYPQDVGLIVEYLSGLWQEELDVVKAKLDNNFIRYLQLTTGHVTP